MRRMQGDNNRDSWKVNYHYMNPICFRGRGHISAKYLLISVHKRTLKKLDFSVMSLKIGQFTLHPVKLSCFKVRRNSQGVKRLSDEQNVLKVKKIEGSGHQNFMTP